MKAPRGTSLWNDELNYTHYTIMYQLGYVQGKAGTCGCEMCLAAEKMISEAIAINYSFGKTLKWLGGKK